MVIKDTNGNEINLIPFQIKTGEESLPVTIRIFPESNAETLTADNVADVTVWGKIGAGAYQNLTATPLAVGGYFGGSVDVQIKVKASNTLSGINRKYVFLGSKLGGAALWLG